MCIQWVMINSRILGDELSSSTMLHSFCQLVVATIHQHGRTITWNHFVTILRDSGLHLAESFLKPEGPEYDRPGEEDAIDGAIDGAVDGAILPSAPSQIQHDIFLDTAQQHEIWGLLEVVFKRVDVAETGAVDARFVVSTIAIPILQHQCNSSLSSQCSVLLAAVNNDAELASITSFPKAASGQLHDVPVSTSCAVPQNLLPGARYAFQVAAANELGEGLWSEPSETIVCAGDDYPMP
jgi:hypothetical protein